MSYQSDIYSAVTGDATMAGLIGTKFSWDIADGGTAPPYVVAQTITTRGETTHDGVRNIEFPRIQFSCWAKTKSEAINIVSKLNNLLDGNTIAGASAVTFQFSNQISQYESATELFGEIIEYQAKTITN